MNFLPAFALWKRPRYPLGEWELLQVYESDTAAHEAKVMGTAAMPEFDFKVTETCFSPR